jgi:hypothetical protein
MPIFAGKAKNFLALLSTFNFLRFWGATADCICPLIFDPVCDLKGKVVAGNSCEAACKQLPKESYSAIFCGGTRGSESPDIGWVLPSKIINYGYSKPEYDGVVRSTYFNERYEALLEPSGERLSEARSKLSHIC